MKYEKYDLPQVNLNGNKEVYIENYLSIAHFDVSKVVLRLKKGLLKIEGNNLKIQYFNTEEIVITGELKTVDFENQ